MPFYYGSKARSVPEYLKMRFDERVRALNSIAFAVMTRVRLRHFDECPGQAADQPAAWAGTILGMDFGSYDVYLWICSAVVLLYVLKGGLTSAIYTEVLQFFMIVLGFAPVVYLGLKDVGGWHAMKQTRCRLSPTNPAALYAQDAKALPTRQRLDQRLEAAAGRARRQSDGRGLVRDGVRSRFRAVVRLLVHQFPRGPARDGGQEHDRRPPHAAHRRRAQDALPRAGHSARHDRRRPGLDAGQGLPHPAADPLRQELYAKARCRPSNPAPIQPPALKTAALRQNVSEPMAKFK